MTSVIVQPAPETDHNNVTPDRLSQAIEWLTRREPAEVLAARERILGAAPPRDIPAGKSVIDMVEGKWPGTESDADIREALDQLS
jgi:hypothetical protein